MKRSPYEFAVRHDSETEGLDSRFGLSAGKQMVVMDIEPVPNEGIINLGVWG